ncbi:MAG: Gfo/Idh/MocA family oxidoreductase [Acidobacteria bacterium]|nr:Gfo/Idh/MocA family oxidoreductase [Acidobacteriota bacterium]MCB9397353.1 Gfo/Idh/MocA family oxidoreductase [Acidobacteriota bacterium]
MTVKVGVIGVGALGRHHARLYQQCPNAQLVGVYDAAPETLARVSEELGVAPFADMHELLSQCDAVSLATPTDLHFAMAQEILNAQKHLLVEKPITVLPEEAEVLIQMAKSHNRVLQVGHVERFNPVIVAFEGKVENPRFIESHRMASYPPPRPGALPRGTEVGVVLDLMIHDIDIVLHLVKSEVASVDSVGIPVLSKSEDIANARIKFENGCVANLTASRVSHEPMRKIRIFEPNAYLSLDYSKKAAEVYRKVPQGIHRESVPIDDHNALLHELQHFVGCVAAVQAGGSDPASKVPGEHGLRALKLATEIIRLFPDPLDLP